MQYLQLKHQLREFTVFSLLDIRKLDVNFHRRRLNEWQEKGYIKKIIRGYYIFSDLSVNEPVLFEIANRIYSPSYVSLESALAYYGLIPESTYGVTSLSTRRTYRFSTSLGEFSYRTIKPALFFGYRLVEYKGKYFKIAEIEKAILDYCYINTGIKTASDFKSLRFNTELFRKKVDEKKVFLFLERFKQKMLVKRTKILLEHIAND